QRHQPNKTSRWPWWFAVGTGVIGVALSFFAWARLEAIEKERLTQEFHAQAEAVRNAAQREVNLYMEVLESIRDLHSISTTISPENFAEFVNKGMMHQKRVLGAFGFVQSIPAEQRGQIEKDPASPLSFVEADEH